MTCFEKYMYQTCEIILICCFKWTCWRVRTNDLNYVIFYDTYNLFSKYWAIMLHLIYSNLVLKLAYSNNQISSIIKWRLCGFVGNADNNGINFNDPLWGQFSCYGMAISYRHTPRCWHSSRQKVMWKGRLSKIRPR